MNLYRLTRQQYATDLSGEGAKLYGGRWNSAGVPLLYTATHRSLAVLETLVNLPKNLMPKDMLLITLEVDVKGFEVMSNLPKNWREHPASRTTQKLGDAWAKSGQLGIYVPSTVIPQEYNVILNPLEDNYSNKLKVVEKVPFGFDKRLFV